MDIVIEGPAREIIAFEVKVGATVRERDFRGIRRLQTMAKKQFKTGIVFYDGDKNFIIWGKSVRHAIINALGA